MPATVTRPWRVFAKIHQMTNSQQTDIKLESVSIEWLNADPERFCVLCKKEVGSGPVGFSKADPVGPVCDDCMLELHPELGMLLLFANAGRDLANHSRDPLEAAEYREGLMTLAKIYDVSAQWPRRSEAVFHYMRDLLKQILKRAADIPLDALIKMIGEPPN